VRLQCFPQACNGLALLDYGSVLTIYELTQDQPSETSRLIDLRIDQSESLIMVTDAWKARGGILIDAEGTTSGAPTLGQGGFWGVYENRDARYLVVRSVQPELQTLFANIVRSEATAGNTWRSLFENHPILKRVEEAHKEANHFLAKVLNLALTNRETLPEPVASISTGFIETRGEEIVCAQFMQPCTSTVYWSFDTNDLTEATFVSPQGILDAIEGGIIQDDYVPMFRRGINPLYANPVLPGAGAMFWDAQPSANRVRAKFVTPWMWSSDRLPAITPEMSPGAIIKALQEIE
jgi:hypothetical protein